VNIATWLARRALRSPDTPAIFDGFNCVVTYETFEVRVRAVAHWLKRQGVSAGDRVAIFMENAPEYLFVQYGAWYAGAVIVPINAKLHAKEARWIIENSEAVLTISSAAKVTALIEAKALGEIVDAGFVCRQETIDHDAICAHRNPDDLAWLFYTSGTTGQPKGVMISHRMLVSMSMSYLSDVDTVSQRDAAIYAAPMSHGAGLYNMVHVLKGARHVFPASRGFESQEIFGLARYFGSVHMFAAPTMVKRLTDVACSRGEDGTGLRTIVYAGGPMYEADILAASEVFGDIFVQIYGQGECPMGITVLSRGDVVDRQSARWKARLKSVGHAQSAVEVRTADDNGKSLDVDQIGEIQVRGDTVMQGYWRNEQASAKTFEDGWLKTGDIGSIDAEGYVSLVDRSKDLIISGGTNIYPREVEEVLLQHRDVSETSVVGASHPEWGEEVVAFIVLSDGFRLDEAALDAHCLDNIARFKRPKRYVQLNELPKNNYGKVLKTALRRLL
jgi:long-chain acyl-CoA synthetase